MLNRKSYWKDEKKKLKDEERKQEDDHKSCSLTEGT